MFKHKIIFILLIVLAISPLVNFSSILDPYGYSTLILTDAINTNGSIDFQGFTLGDHWRGHAKSTLGDIRPLTSILIVMLNQITFIDPVILANIPLFALLLPLIAFLFMRKFLSSNNDSMVGLILLLFFIVAVSLLQPGGLNYLSYGFFLAFLLFYLGIRWLKNSSSIEAILVLIVFIASSRIYYTSYISSAIFLFVMLLYVILFSREKRRSISFALIGVVFLFIVLWYDNIVQATFITLSFENINQAINSILMFKTSTPQFSGPYLEISSSSYLLFAHSIIRVGLGILGSIALITSLKNRFLKKELPIVTGLFFMGLFETVSYVFVGGIFIVRLLFAICLPFVIVLWVARITINAKYKRIGTLILVILCLLSLVIIFKNYEDTNRRQVIVNNAFLIDSVSFKASFFFDRNTSYFMIAGSTESALLSYRTFKIGCNALAGFGPLLQIANGKFDAFMHEINQLPQNEKLVYTPSSYPYIEVYAWGEIYSFKSEFYQELDSNFNRVYEGPFLIHEKS
jgi:hypothetical protein